MESPQVKEKETLAENEADKIQNVATALESLSKPFITVASIAVLLTGYAYLLGDRYHSGFYRELGIPWVANNISFLDKANGSSTFLALTVVLAGMVIFFYSNATATFRGILKFHLWLLAACLSTWILHFLVRSWLGYESYWYIAGIILSGIAAGVTIGICILSVAENPKERINAIYVAIISLGLTSAPMGAQLLGEMRGKDFIGGDYVFLSYAKIDEKDRCSWRVAQSLNSEKLLIVSNQGGFLYKTIDTDNVAEFWPANDPRCKKNPNKT